jgi:hypothetical protein
MRNFDILISMTGRRLHKTFHILSSARGDLLNIDQGEANIGCSQVDVFYESIVQSQDLRYLYSANTPQFACASPQNLKPCGPSSRYPTT